MVSLWVSLAIVLVIIIVAVAVYFIVFHKNSTYSLTDPTGQGNICTYDSDCPINPDGTALRCVNSQPPAGATEGTKGTCTAYCVQNTDCSYGNSPQSPTCVTNGTTGQSLCMLQACNAQSDCSTGEACLPLAPGVSQNYCVVLGNNPATATYSSQSIPCSQNTCFNIAGITCLKGTGGQAVGSPQWNNPCVYNNDCNNNAGGIPCSTGCYPSAGTNNPQSGCPQPADKTSSTLPPGKCGDVPFSSASWPLTNTGYCVQSCTSDTDCATGLTCDTTLSACTD